MRIFNRFRTNPSTTRRLWDSLPNHRTPPPLQAPPKPIQQYQDINRKDGTGLLTLVEQEGTGWKAIRDGKPWFILEQNLALNYELIDGPDEEREAA